ncbi:hypothetical protein, partial [Jiulongibacter sediminis]|uniref:hypothetical protein n=1 Tax=Jiulongibacter sediminis TaxID=1605367 RepID=UPI0026F05BDA
MPQNLGNSYGDKLNVYRNYFEAIATKYKPIGHTPGSSRFETYSRAAVMAGRRKREEGFNLTQFCLILLDATPSFNAASERRNQLELEGAFEIVKFNERNDLDQYAIQAQAFNMCEEIAAHMIQEHSTKNTGGGFSLGNLIEDSIDFYIVDEVFDKAVGYGCSFRYSVGFDKT